MPAEFIQYFDPHYPVILGGLLSNEETLGFVQVASLCCANVTREISNHYLSGAYQAPQVAQEDIEK